MNEEKKREGISLRKLNYIMTALTLAISVTILISTFLTSKRYTTVERNTLDYISWQQSAEKLQSGSDVLTEEVRSFAVTGDRAHLDRYFEEATVTKQRETSLEALKDVIGGTEAYEHLEAAMEKSLELMKVEYYSMKLTCVSRGYDLSEFPAEVRSVVLSLEDGALSPDEMALRAERMLFDEEYHDCKDEITKQIHYCVSSLADFTEQNISTDFSKLSAHLLIQQILMVGLVVVTVVVIILTSAQVISPLIKAIPHIKGDKPLPLKGAYEYRYLAHTYNKMYDANRKQKKQLNYEATHDALTDVFNRAGYEKILPTLDVSGMTALMVDIDSFKGINDTYGHAAGDSSLVKVVGELRRKFRSNDMIFRIGGDEFVVIMHGAPATDETKELIRKKIQSINASLSKRKEGEPDISISAGGAFAGEEDSAETVVKNADDALYYVKEHGKRDCRFYDDIRADS